MFGNVFTAIDHDIARFTMSIMIHREVEGLFRTATKRVSTIQGVFWYSGSFHKRFQQKEICLDKNNLIDSHFSILTYMVI